jgi:hypothetical protein
MAATVGLDSLAKCRVAGSYLVPGLAQMAIAPEEPAGSPRDGYPQRIL